MATQAYINRAMHSGEHRFPVETLHWIHNHPTTVKAAKIAVFIFGAALLATLPFSIPAIGGAAILLALTGAALTLASIIAFAALDILAPPHHDMGKHLYKPGQCEGGRLYYHGDLPILSITAEDPYVAGKAHGTLAAEGIYRLSRRFTTAVHVFLRRPRAEKLSHILEPLKAKIPEVYLREMQGIVDGYNDWVKKHPFKFAKKVSFDEMLLLHLLPDSVHLNTGGYRRKPALVGCSAIVDKDRERGVVFARNLDWLSLNIVSKYTLVLHRKRPDGLSTIELAIPGFAGTLTGMNEQGLSLAMNVCIGETKEAHGMPAIVFNRYCLDTCRNLADVRAFADRETPLGPYHLTVADTESAQSFHFFQNGQKYTTQRLEEARPLTVLNWRHEPDPYAHGEIHHSRARQKTLEAYFRKAHQEIPQEEMERGQLVEAALALPSINNHETVHTVVMEPATRSFKVALDEAFSGHTPMQEIPVRRLFGPGRRVRIAEEHNEVHVF